MFFFFNDPATPEIYTLSLHDALPIWSGRGAERIRVVRHAAELAGSDAEHPLERLRERELRDVADLLRDRDRKSTRLNSSHLGISYAVFCLKKKKKKTKKRIAQNKKQR